MNINPRLLAMIGIALAGPAFLLNVAAHGGEMPGPDDVDRLDGFFSLIFMMGAFAVVSALIATTPSPLGRKGRWLLYVEAVMIALGGLWAALVMNDPDVVDSKNPIVLIGDACWPLHQALMLVTGTVAVRARRWPDPARFSLYGPAIGLGLLAVGAGTGIDVLAAAGIGSGWVIATAGVFCVAPCERGSDATRALAGSTA